MHLRFVCISSMSIHTRVNNKTSDFGIYEDVVIYYLYINIIEHNNDYLDPNSDYCLFQQMYSNIERNMLTIEDSLTF